MMKINKDCNTGTVNRARSLVFLWAEVEIGRSRKNYIRKSLVV